MIDAIKTSQIAMNQDQERLQTISQNISNMQTPAYKRQLIEKLDFKNQMHNAQILTQGSLVQTQNPKDIALAGDGFFTLQTEEGIFYSRRGDLLTNNRGELSSATGGLILGNNGIIQVDDNEFTIDTQGDIYIDNRKIDRLKIAQFSKPQTLQYRGRGLYETSESPNTVISTTRILQGFIEQSNVKSVDEMMDMVKISRHFEASQRAMHIADSLLSTAINQLGTAHE